MFKRKFVEAIARVSTNKRIRSDKVEVGEDAEVDLDLHIANHFLGGGNNVVSEIGNHLYYRGPVSMQNIARLIDTIKRKNDQFIALGRDPAVQDVKPNPLFLHITSYGGDLMAGLMAADAIAHSKIPIHTIIEGYAASAGTIMSVVGAKRFITPHSYALVHQLSAGSVGNYEHLKDDSKNFKKFMDDLKQLYTDHTKLDKRDLARLMKHDLWWSAEVSIEKGIADELYLS